MTIDTIFIRSFGKLQNITLELGKGINIIRGDNESGKSTLSNFIKFIFYGPSGRGNEKLKYISWSTMKASGYMIISENGHQFRIDRENICIYGSDGKSKLSERCSITELGTNRIVFQGQVPGEVFFGVDESVFDSTAFIDQLAESKVGGRDLAESAQNILFSGSEDVNVEKALKKLEESRKILLYKNNNGGKIYDLENECSILRQRLEKAETNSSDLIADEGTYREIKHKLDTSKERFKAVSSEMELWNKYTIYKLMKKRQVALNNYTLAQNKEEEALDDKAHDGARVYEDNYIESLKKLENDLKNASALYAEAKKTRDDASSKMKSIAEKVQLFNNLGTDPVKRNDLISNIKSNYKKSKTLNSLSFVCLVLSVILLVAAAAAFFVASIPQSLTLYFIIGSALFFAVAIVLMFLKANVNKALKKKYKLFQCKNYAEFNEMLSAALKDETTITYITESLRSAEENLSSKTESINNINSKVVAKLSGDRFEVSENTLESLESAISECQKYKSQLNILSNNTIVEKRAVDDIDETLSQYKRSYLDEVMAMTFDETAMADFDYERKNKEYRFLSVSIENLDSKLKELEKEIAVLRATNDDPARLAVELDEKSQKLDYYKQKFVAYMMAIEAVKNASGRLRESISPKIADSAGKYLSELSDGKYNSLSLDSDFSVSYSDGEYTRSADNLSAGTEDITYISLRLALIETLYKEAYPPLVFDESFSRTDDNRLKKALTLMTRLSEQGLQSILFTCHNREERVMETVGKYTLAKLS